MRDAKQLTKLVIFCPLLFLSFLFGHGRAQAIDTSPIPEWKPYPTFGIEITDASTFPDMAGSVLFTNEAGGNSPIVEKDYIGYDRLCSSVEIEVCNPEKKTLTARSVLSPCLGDISSPCIDSVRITDNLGENHELNFIRTIKGNTYKGNLKYKLPNGGTISLWRASNLKGIKDYAVSYSIDYYQKSPTDDFFKPRMMNLSIQPFIERKNPKARNFYYQEVPPSSPNRLNNRMGVVMALGLNDFGINCAWQEDGVCGVEQELETNFRYSASILMPKAFTGWLQGRLSSPQIDLQTISNDLNKLTVNADAVMVPRVTSDIEYSRINDEVLELFKGSQNFESKSSFRNLLATDSLDTVKYLNAFNRFLNDKANLLSTKWSFKTMDKDDGFNSNKCLVSTTQLMGMVTTNAMIYEGGVPEFRGGSLEYRVAGLRLNPDNTVFLGAYDLILRSEAAGCLYQFSSAPVFAEISVTGLDGEKKVATTKVSEEKGWLHLGAYNFTFSQPTIKMTLKQEVVASTPTPTPSASSTPTRATSILKKSTVTCVKGKQTRKVTAISPKCPVGYKKK